MDAFKRIHFLFIIWQIFGIFYPSVNSKHLLSKLFIKLVWFLFLITYFSVVFLHGIIESYRYIKKAKLNIFTTSDMLTMNLFRFLSLIMIIELFLKRKIHAKIISRMYRIDAIICDKFFIKMKIVEQRKEIFWKTLMWLFVFIFTEGVSLSYLTLRLKGFDYVLYLELFAIPLWFSGIYYFEFYCFVFLVTHRLNVFIEILKKSFLRESQMTRPRKHLNLDYLLKYLWDFYEELSQTVDCINHLFAVSMSVNLTTSFLNLLSICYYAFSHIVGSNKESTQEGIILFSLLAIYSCFCILTAVNMCHRFHNEVTRY